MDYGMRFLDSMHIQNGWTQWYDEQVLGFNEFNLYWPFTGLCLLCALKLTKFTHFPTYA